MALDNTRIKAALELLDNLEDIPDLIREAIIEVLDEHVREPVQGMIKELAMLATSTSNFPDVEAIVGMVTSLRALLADTIDNDGETTKLEGVANQAAYEMNDVLDETGRHAVQGDNRWADFRQWAECQGVRLASKEGAGEVDSHADNNSVCNDCFDEALIDFLAQIGEPATDATVNAIACVIAGRRAQRQQGGDHF
jgi:hypothetical protein